MAINLFEERGHLWYFPNASVRSDSIGTGMIIKLDVGLRKCAQCCDEKRSKANDGNDRVSKKISRIAAAREVASKLRQ
jgi:hypothetical protein